MTVISARTSQAALDLAARDEALPDLPLLLGLRPLETAAGVPAAREYLRYKPGASAVAGLRAADGTRHWIVTYADPGKLDKSIERARKAGAQFRLLTARTLVGPAAADRVLAPRLRELGALGTAPEDRAVIRYVPQRRLVLRDGGRAVKVSVGEVRDRAARMLADRGLPVLVPERHAPGISTTPWWGDGDLTRCPDDAALARQAGSTLAEVHSVPVSRAVLPPLDPAELARQAARTIGVLRPVLAARAREAAATIARRCTLTAPVFSHGDFSPDQVLAGESGIRLIDLDRAALAPAEHDLGSYLAAGGNPAILEGYRASGGIADDDALRAWEALARLRTTPEPFRRGHARWPEELERRLQLTEALLSDRGRWT